MCSALATARTLCLLYPAAVHHVMNRRLAWQPVFRTTAGRQAFLAGMAEAGAGKGDRARRGDYVVNLLKLSGMWGEMRLGDGGHHAIGLFGFPAGPARRRGEGQTRAWEPTCGSGLLASDCGQRRRPEGGAGPCPDCARRTGATSRGWTCAGDPRRYTPRCGPWGPFVDFGCNVSPGERGADLRGPRAAAACRSAPAPPPG